MTVLKPTRRFHIVKIYAHDIALFFDLTNDGRCLTINSYISLSSAVLALIFSIPFFTSNSSIVINRGERSISDKNYRIDYMYTLK